MRIFIVLLILASLMGRVQAQTVSHEKWTADAAAYPSNVLDATNACVLADPNDLETAKKCAGAGDTMISYIKAHGQRLSRDQRAHGLLVAADDYGTAGHVACIKQTTYLANNYFRNEHKVLRAMAGTSTSYTTDAESRLRSNTFSC